MDKTFGNIGNFKQTTSAKYSGTTGWLTNHVKQKPLPCTVPKIVRTRSLAYGPF